MPSKKAQTIGLILILCLVSGCATNAVKENPASNAMKVNSLWQGTFHQVGWDEPYPMVLFVSSRTGNAFEGATWYPSLGYGLITMSGEIKPDGVITFTEEKVIYQGSGVISGTIYPASLEGDTLKGVATIRSRKAGDFTLKLAD
jgi:hypothetical protein